MSQIITLEQLKQTLKEKLASGARVVAPVLDGDMATFKPITNVEKASFEPRACVQNSIKEFFFPKHETLFSFVRQGNDVVLTDAADFDVEQIVVGARPCDAAALPILDPLFAWDYQDRFYQERRAKTTVVTFACTRSDAHCFCSAVGGAPDNTSGADAILFDLGDGSFEVRAVTEKGTALFAGKTSESDKTGAACEPPKADFDVNSIAAWIRENYSSPLWEKVSLRCVGCGACAFVCPTCHCFDMVDEGSYNKGKRVRNWDSCQEAMFTLHASGHNPRGTQGKRQRQRLAHKFVIYPDKFKSFLCTGCGSCSRSCGQMFGVRPCLEALDKQGVKAQQ
ncbi:MAG: 4Fe-4S dicluster domain-containing protein [Thermoguttaceae bacterium]|nr:4Fe-4S dicluster domain-containing protein [Thermoguttaceae bacterium]